MLPGEIRTAIAGNPGLQAGYNNFLSWIAAGAKHGTLGGLVPNEAVVRVSNTPWGENLAYDAAGNVISQYRPARAGETSPYGPAGSGGPSAPEWTPGQLAAMFVPDAFKAKNLTSTGAANPSMLAALALKPHPGETEEEYERRIAREKGIA